MSASKILARMRASGVPPSEFQFSAQSDEKPTQAPQFNRNIRRVIVDSDSEDEDDPPQSVVWELDSRGEAPDILDPKFDWRRETRRGKKSRKNYSSFLADRIRENEDLAQMEREAQDNGGPDFE